MTHRFIYLLLLLCSVSFARGFTVGKDSLEWKELSREKYTLYYSLADQNIINRIDNYITSGLNYIVDHFHHSIPNKFDVYIFPDRVLLNKQWQKDWIDPAFQSECWMIASGVAHRLDILSPNTWAKQACDHNGNDTTEVRQVIWHELVHIFHGQQLK